MPRYGWARTQIQLHRGLLHRIPDNPHVLGDHGSDLVVDQDLPRINALPADLFAGAPARAKTIGLRPEHIQCGEGKPSTVVRIEHLGDQTRLHLTLDNHAIVTLTDVHTELKPGNTVAIQPRDALCFDTAGARIACGVIQAVPAGA